MTELTSSEVFMMSALFGGALGFVYGIFTAARIIISARKIITFILDFIFALLWGFVLFVISTELTGEIRYFTVTGMIMGFVLIKLTCGNLLAFIANKISFGAGKIFHTVSALITKIMINIKMCFVKKCLNFKKRVKIEKKPLKVDF